MNDISELLDKRAIKVRLKSRRKREVIEELVSLLTGMGKVEAPGKVVEELLKREKISSTGIGGGIAIPHVLSDFVRQTTMAFGRSEEGIQFDAMDKQPVYLFFLLLGPKGHQSEHLKLLSKLSRLLKHEQFVKALLKAETTDEVLSIIKEQE